MLAVVDQISKSSGSAVHRLLESIEVVTGADCTPSESRRFLLSALSVTKAATAAVDPTAQEVECLRQATFRHRLETGDSRATGGDLMPTLQRLGYA